MDKILKKITIEKMREQAQEYEANVLRPSARGDVLVWARLRNLNHWNELNGLKEILREWEDDCEDLAIVRGVIHRYNNYTCLGHNYYHVSDQLKLYTGAYSDLTLNWETGMVLNGKTLKEAE